MKAKYRVAVGNINQPFDESHSEEFFHCRKEMIAYFWAMRKVMFPQRVWMNLGADGWQNNDGTVDKNVPYEFAARVAELVAEDNAITLSGIAKNEMHLAA